MDYARLLKEYEGMARGLQGKKQTNKQEVVKCQELNRKIEEILSLMNNMDNINTDRCCSSEWCPAQKSCPWRWSSPAKCPCLLVCASPWRQPGLFCDDTHAKRKRSEWA